MKRKRLLWQLYPVLVLVAVLPVLLVSWYATRTLQRSCLENTAADLEARAGLVAAQLSDELTPENAPALDALCKHLGSRSGTRITIVLPSGMVLGDSDEDPAAMDNHADRPEIREAFSGGVGQSIRYSATLQRRMMYVAVPFRAEGQMAAVVRTSLPVYSLEAALGAARTHIIVSAATVLLLAGAGSFFLARRLSHPLEEMKQAAHRFALGALDTRVPVPASAELGELADVLNRLAEQLGDKIRLLEQQRNEQAAVFSSMMEAVIAVDRDERIISFNDAAAALFGTGVVEARGRSLQEVVRNTDLQAVLAEAAAGSRPVEREISVYNGAGERYLQAHAVPLADAQGHHMGVLVVLNDVTRLRKLENVRRDFVANVSHELKTPITSIKGFVETLQDGAIDQPEDAKRFLDIMDKQANRLASIIEDLLTLSRIEQDAERGEVALQDLRVRPIAASAIQLCQVKAQAKDVAVEVECPPELAARADAALLEQALVNLIDNAIKYSREGGRVLVEAAASQGGILLSVRDWGCGIAAEHLPRLFERFYRVDKARSRQLGGTGLGLAIVKHIVNAHGGRVTVQSAPGEGSVFSLHLRPAGHAPAAA